MKRHLAFALFSAAGAATILLILEASFRILAPVPAPPALMHPVVGEWAEHDPLLFWRLRPQIVEEGELLTNSLGLRGPEVPLKAADEFRILSLGESTTFGRRLSYRETYSSLLEEEVGSVGGKRVRVINAGVPAYTLFQGVTYLEHRGLALDPDAVIVYFGFNDFLPAVARGATTGASVAGSTDAERFRHLRSRAGQLRFWLTVHSNLFRWISSRREPMTDEPVSDVAQLRVPKQDRIRSLTRLKKLSDREGLRLVVVIPWYPRFEAHAPLLRRFARVNDVSLVDLPSELRELPKPRAAYFSDRLHPTAEGHRLIARIIRENLERLWEDSTGAPAS